MIFERNSLLKGTVIILMFFTPSIIQAAGNDTTTINYSVAAINELNLDGGPYSLLSETAIAGEQPDWDTHQGTYDITTNCAANGKKITAQINSDMPTGVALFFDMDGPAGSSSAPDYLSATAVNIITGIDASADSNRIFFIDLEVTVEAGVVSSSRTLTVTLTDS
jgi:hypothetical protein